MNGEALTEFDLHLISEGTHYRTYEKLGAHPGKLGDGVYFRVWAPNAQKVSVIGDFNGWNREAAIMRSHGNTGIWECFVPGAGHGSLYKYFIESRYNGYSVEKADPYGFAAEIRPQTASKVWDLSRYRWNDEAWMAARQNRFLQEAAMSIYELHLGSWMRVAEEGNRWLSYRESAQKLVDYIRHMGFTHVELLPVSEHPFDGSWGYQTVGYFAPTSRFGTPDDFRYLVDMLHQNGIGVILDWVPAHFPRDEHGLGYFDGTHLYEHADHRQGLHPDWDTLVFNYGRTEVRNFLISNALFWFDRYHIDALRVDAVASMLYLDYGRTNGDWIPNCYGGNENLEAVDFLKLLNERVHAEAHGATVIAEESTAWPMVSRPTYLGGLGFGFKWNMGWMHDMIEYMSHDPVHRSYHHNNITFSMLYAFSENFVLPFSHDETVHGKGSMIGKMPGDQWQKFASLRVLYGYMFGHPGKKMLFMGCEFGQWNEWNHDASLDWHLLEYPLHAGLHRWVRDLNTFYRSEPALFELDSEPAGFEWIDCNDSQGSVVSFVRRGKDRRRQVVFVLNFTPVPRHNYRVGVPEGGYWREALNSDAHFYGGSGRGNLGGVEASPLPMHGRPCSLAITLPPLAAVVFHKEA
ncbi:MAG TPA: 1,4-alpha-glucan branching protein GlgB [Acidobacteriota bacterium]|nr:1,4-alpha-glucan branching protein GlgB [Acidobacteriota bacterium]